MRQEIMGERGDVTCSKVLGFELWSAAYMALNSAMPWPPHTSFVSHQGHPGKKVLDTPLRSFPILCLCCCRIMFLYVIKGLITAMSLQKFCLLVSVQFVRIITSIKYITYQNVHQRNGHTVRVWQPTPKQYELLSLTLLLIYRDQLP